ncbi:MAG TPA: hydrogenase maturation nickel metallochaperone HypA [Longimicrobiales bacterium]|nr:hydrogenase maturation nickel metallochaperone HypA [Longimicrobiales bacterium]
MHEMSIAMEVCRIARDRVGFEALPRVREIGLTVGGRSGVEPESLRFCLEALLEREPFAGARPVLELTAGDELSVSYLEIDDGDPPN